MCPAQVSTLSPTEITAAAGGAAAVAARRIGALYLAGLPPPGLFAGHSVTEHAVLEQGWWWSAPLSSPPAPPPAACTTRTRAR